MKKTFASIVTLALVAATFVPSALAWPSFKEEWYYVCPDDWTGTTCFSGASSCTPLRCLGEIKQ